MNQSYSGELVAELFTDTSETQSRPLFVNVIGTVHFDNPFASIDVLSIFPCRHDSVFEHAQRIDVTVLYEKFCVC
jgi:urate oxidase